MRPIQLKKKNEFLKELKTEVYQSLADQNQGVKCPKELVLKALVLFSLWAILYCLYLFSGQLHWGLTILLAIPWGMVMLSIQMAVMHDGSHGASSESATTNFMLTLPIAFVGGSAYLWIKQHCQAHHSFTNVHHKDHDINTNGLLRLHHHEPLKDHHRYQHIYAWLLYPLFVLSWIWWGDFRDIINNTYSLTKIQLKKAIWDTVAVKIWHIGLFIFLPIYFIGNVWVALAGYFLSFAIMGFFMVIIFQLAHVSERQLFPKTSDELVDDWAIRQVLTTVNFATHSRALTWLIGGLNFQIEHHIFPQMSHPNYPRIQKLVEKMCVEREMPYFTYPTLKSAVAAHQLHLKRLGMGTR